MHPVDNFDLLPLSWEGGCMVSGREAVYSWEGGCMVAIQNTLQNQGLRAKFPTGTVNVKYYMNKHLRIRCMEIHKSHF